MTVSDAFRAESNSERNLLCTYYLQNGFVLPYFDSNGSRKVTERILLSPRVIRVGALQNGKIIFRFLRSPTLLLNPCLLGQSAKTELVRNVMRMRLIPQCTTATYYLIILILLFKLIRKEIRSKHPSVQKAVG